jgi:nucleoside-diphosphate-sugar epimerase
MFNQSENPGANRVLVVGATGRIGTLLRPFWQNTKTNNEYVYQTRTANPDYDITWSPLEGSAPFKRNLSGPPPYSAILLLAGVVPGSNVDFSLNAALANAVLATACKVAIPRVLLASSSAVYGSYKNQPYSELDSVKPSEPYGKAKLEMEQICDRWRLEGLDISCLRIGNVAGADALLTNIDNKPILLDCFENGRGPTRSYIGPLSLAQTLDSLLSLSEPLPEIINVAAPHPVEMESLLEAASIDWRYRKVSHNTGQTITLDCARLKALRPFSEQESTAREIIRQWRSVKDFR